MRIRAKFERFQEYYVMNIQFKDPKSPCTTGKMYVGKYFTLKGEFDEVSTRTMRLLQALRMMNISTSGRIHCGCQDTHRPVRHLEVQRVRV